MYDLFVDKEGRTTLNGAQYIEYRLKMKAQTETKKAKTKATKGKKMKL